MVHSILGQRYELNEHIGGGGMADVYMAEDLLLKRIVAVKILHEQFRSDEEFINKFHREAQSAAGLSHPNIVSIYDVGVSGNDHYIVMEYVPGHTLKRRIQTEGKLPVADALNIAYHIADALSAAHAAGIVHCDIKPHNILLSQDGMAKVADFGIARAVTESTVTYSGNVVGSVHYFSPEQAKGTYITPKSDVYSLGVVMYEMLTGKLPFTGDTPVSIAMKHLQETPMPIRKIDPNIPPLVESIVMQAMNKDPNGRPDSAEMARDILEAAKILHTAIPQTEVMPDPYATQFIPRVENTISESDNEDENEQAEKSSFVSKLAKLGLVLVLAVGFCVGAFLSFGKFWNKSEVVVPDVVGKQMTLARQILEDSRLRVNVAETFNGEVPAGQVVSQTPEGNATVREERLVTIYVSKGGEDIEMPDLNGLSRSDAQTKIQKIGLTLGSIYEKYADEEAGTVISTDPRHGNRISKGQVVDLTVSKGPRTRNVSVPDVTGGTLEAGRDSLTSHKLIVGNITKTPSRQAEGTIVSQSPVSGSTAEEGSAVNLVIAEPVAETQPTETKPSAESAANSRTEETAVTQETADNEPSPNDSSGKKR